MDNAMGRSGVRVLVVDDNRVIRGMVGARLRAAGCVVSEASDGAEALESFNRQPVEVVITDLNMPRLDGLELLAALRRREAAPEVILLTGTGRDDTQAAVQALRLGAHDYIAKDASSGDALMLAVERAAEKWRLRLENARLLAELRQLSLTDSLTGLGNRRALDEALRQEISRAQRGAAPLSLVLVDLDGFKALNDTHGHRVGDAVLASFAQRLRGVAREADRLFRYGGEEFVLLAGDTTEEGAEALAARVVWAVAGEPLGAGRLSLEVTCSAGVAELQPADGFDGAGLVARADGALYEAKRAGRNRVALAGDRRRTNLAAPSQGLADLAGKAC